MPFRQDGRISVMGFDISNLKEIYAGVVSPRMLKLFYLKSESHMD
jgi:hypothetical protein